MASVARSSAVVARRLRIAGLSVPGWGEMTRYAWARLDAWVSRRTPRLWKFVVAALTQLTSEARFSPQELLLASVLLLRLQRASDANPLSALGPGWHHRPGTLPLDRSGHLLLPSLGAPVFDRAELGETRRVLRHALAAYATSDAAVCASLGMPASALLRTCWVTDADSLLPAYYMAVDSELRAVVVSVRGTFSLADTLLNFTVTPHEFAGGCVHRGMYICARQLVDALRTAGKLSEVMAAHPDHDLLLTGHSLGGAVAAMMAIILKVRYPHTRAIVFSPPSCMSKPLADSCAPYVRSVVAGDDVVARFHLDSVIRLRRALSSLDVQTEVLRSLGLEGVVTPQRVDALLRLAVWVGGWGTAVWQGVVKAVVLLSAPLRGWAPATAALSS